ncbi:MAG: glucose-1-phosphate cytidylyltransferase [Vicinamibacteria bacterium]|nr:glucose-1-phosphate cytidylyltransferase [Vicinamibacteria bacterium]
MKVVILAGGRGSRLAEETEVKPKPLVEIGGRPILWHIMKLYAHYGFREFYIALGYKGEQIKRYFLDYLALSGNVTVDLGRGSSQFEDRQIEDWTIHMVDTGIEANTGGRVKRLEPFLQDGTFMVTYGDGVSNVDLQELLRFHQSNKRLATLTAVRPPARFGGLIFDGERIAQFTEKPQAGEGWINGGFLVLEPGVFEYLPGDQTSLEADTMERLARDGQLAGYRHPGFWQCMDTLRDLQLLQSLWASPAPPWKVWA